MKNQINLQEHVGRLDKKETRLSFIGKSACILHCNSLKYKLEKEKIYNDGTDRRL